jgi:hypothetical protein
MIKRKLVGCQASEQYPRSDIFYFAPALLMFSHLKKGLSF